MYEELGATATDIVDGDLTGIALSLTTAAVDTSSARHLHVVTSTAADDGAGNVGIEHAHGERAYLIPVSSSTYQSRGRRDP